MRKPLILGSGVSSFKDRAGLMNICEAAIEYDILCFDTAPSYRTEEVLSGCILEILRRKGQKRESVSIQTKIDPIQMYEGNVEEYFKSKLAKMGLDYVDALLIHWPVHNYFMKTWEAISRLRDGGLTKKIGICNLRINHLKELQGMSIVPEILQIERHPLNVFQEERDFCLQNHIELQDYSPLCKMHPILRDSVELKSLSEKYGKDIGSIILRWHIDTMAVPIFTSKKVQRIATYSMVDAFQLSADDIDIVNSLNVNHKLYLESLVCPGF